MKCAELRTRHVNCTRYLPGRAGIEDEGGSMDEDDLFAVFDAKVRGEGGGAGCEASWETPRAQVWRVCELTAESEDCKSLQRRGRAKHARVHESTGAFRSSTCRCSFGW